MSQPPEPPADAPQEPAQPTQPCEACKGSGKVLRWFGQPSDEQKPCSKCSGTGSVIEVIEEKLTAWQQQIEDRLKKLESRTLGLVRFGRPIEIDQNVETSLNSPELQAKCQEIIRDFLMKERPKL